MQRQGEKKCQIKICWMKRKLEVQKFYKIFSLIRQQDASDFSPKTVCII